MICIYDPHTCREHQATGEWQFWRTYVFTNDPGSTPQSCRPEEGMTKLKQVSCILLRQSSLILRRYKNVPL